MAPQPKEVVIRARIDETMRSLLEELANKRGESMSLVLREAVREYSELHYPELSADNDEDDEDDEGS